MIYLNNAGTTWPKPDSLNEAMQQFAAMPPDEWLEVFDEGVKTVTSFLGIANPDRFLFTQSCTQGLATAFGDFPWNPGDRLLISCMEHHALSRWFYKLMNERSVEGVVIPRSQNGPLDLEFLEAELKKGARMVAISMASNVSGEILPYEEVIRLCKSHGALCLLDGAQTTGLVPINIDELDPDFFVFAGHKGPYGPQGIGGLYISERVSMVCPSAACDITPGDNPASIFPTYCDVGSAPMLTIAGLTAGIKWVEAQGWEKIIGHREKLVKKMRKGLDAIDGLKVVGSQTYGRYTGAVSITTTDVSLKEVKHGLWDRYQIKGSLGFQCAPLAHEALGTAETGTFRFSVGPLNTDEEVDVLLDALTSLCSR